MKKRGEITLPFLIFLVLTVIFLVILFYFVYAASSGAFIYEQIYAKKIALAIDSSVPETEIFLDVGSALETAKKSKTEPKFIIDDKKGIVFVSLGSRKGFSYPFFSNYSVSSEIYAKTHNLKLVVKEK